MVDDCDDARECLCLLLRLWGWQAEPAADEPQAAGPPGGAFAAVTPFGGKELVADSRNGLTPRQIVDGRIRAMQGGDSGTAARSGHRTSVG